MVQPRHIAVLLLAACLTGCGGYAMFDPDTTAAFTSPGKQADWMKGGARTSVSGASDPETTGSTPAAADKTGTAALSSLFARASEDKLNGPPALAAKPAEKTAETPLEKPIAVADAGDTGHSSRTGAASRRENLASRAAAPICSAASPA